MEGSKKNVNGSGIEADFNNYTVGYFSRINNERRRLNQTIFFSMLGAGIFEISNPK